MEYLPGVSAVTWVASVSHVVRYAVSFSIQKVCALVALFLVGVFGLPGAASAQGWGEQTPLQFKYLNQGVANELYRNQLGASAAASASSSGSGSLSNGGNGQSSNQLNNAVQISESNTYNVTITGNNNYLNVSGATVNAQQTSTGTSQANSNSKSGSPPAVNAGSTLNVN